MERILLVIRRARRQLLAQRLRDRSVFFLTAASLLALLLLFTALFLPIYGAGFLAAGLLGLGLLAGLVSGFLRRPSLNEAAALADRTGLQEHLVTALERQEQEDMFSRMQRVETERLLEDYPLKERLKKPPVRQHLVVLGTSLALSVLFLLIPTKAKLLAETRHDLLTAKKEEIEKIEEKLEELKQLEELGETNLADPDFIEKLLAEEKNLPEELEKMLAEKNMLSEEGILSKENREKWEKMLSESAQEIRQAASEADLEEMLKRLDKKEEQLLQQMQGSQLAGNPSGEGLSASAGSSSDQSFDGQKETSGNGENSGDKENRENSGNEMMADASGTTGTGGVTGIGSGATGTTGTSASGTAIASAGNPGEAGGSGSGNGSGTNGGSGNASGNGNGSGSGSGNGNGSGSGNGSGNGNGSGEGTGNGNGSGTGNGGSGGNGSGVGGGWNHGSAVGIEREHASALENETVILPGEVVEGDRLTGAASEDGTSYLSPDQITGEGYAGTRTEYESVLGSYSKKAYGQIERNEIPSDMQDIVKKYFSGLGGK